MNNPVTSISEFKQRKCGSSTALTEIFLSEKTDSSGGGAEDKVSVSQMQILLRRLAEVFSSSKTPGWDGESAEAVSESAFLNATKLLAALPIGLPMPEIYADNDGYIEFEWHKDRKNFSLYVTDTNLIFYAGFFGKEDRLSGRFVFEEVFPGRVETLAKDIFK